MHKVSKSYKDAMSAFFRNRGYISVGIGVVNQEAQSSAKASGSFAYWATPKTLMDTPIDKPIYGTLEENFFKLNGKMLFVPENNELAQFYDTGVTTNALYGAIKLQFDNAYDIKGLTLYFPDDSYPERFSITTKEGTVTYSNNSNKFSTTDVIGTTSYIEFKPLKMKNGRQRFRILNAVMGVGVVFGNSDVSESTYNEFISGISEEVSSADFTMTALDAEDRYNINDENSFTNFMQQGQTVTISEGLELDDGTIEWIKLGTLNLESWGYSKGNLTITAKDKFAFMESRYTAGNKIYTRTAYQEAVSIFTDMGFEPDEYSIDDYLKDITLTNPMPEDSHKNCLQLLANACRAMVYQNADGIINIRGNFANTIDPEDLEVVSSSATSYSKLSNVVIGSDAVYSDFTKDFTTVTGAMYFLPESGADFLDTGYVSNVIAGDDGLFTSNPTLSVVLPAGFSYYGVTINFDGNPPEELTIHTYYNSQAVENINFTGLEANNVLFYEFSVFDTMTFEFTKGAPKNRVLVNKISFGDATDYVLSRQDMLDEPVGVKESPTKSILIKIYTYENDESGNPQEVDDAVYAEKEVSTVGDVRTVENPLISSVEMATTLGEWLAAYYGNNFYYDISYRGDPRLNSQDIIHMESEKVNNMQVTIESLSLGFNGGWNGTLNVRKALKIT